METFIKIFVGWTLGASFIIIIEKNRQNNKMHNTHSKVYTDTTITINKNISDTTYTYTFK